MSRPRVDVAPRPWRRNPIRSLHQQCVMRKTHIFEEDFSHRSLENNELDFKTKLAALRVSPSVVSLVSHKGDDMLFAATGTIIECEGGVVDGGFTCTILTCATLLRGRFEEEASSLNDIKIVAYLSDDASWDAEVHLCDFHFNICLLKINTNGPQPKALVRYLGGLTAEILSHSQSLRRHGDSIVPRDEVIALGRHYRTLDLMAAPGTLCSDPCKLDCDELCTADCRISLGGVGGPLINYDGEVIGINFYHKFYTPFLPMDIVCRCLELLKNNRCIPRYQLGLHVVSLCEITESLLEVIVRKFPTINTGVVVEKVMLGSLAESAGIHLNDVIVECQTKPVRCPLEFYGMMLDMAGGEVEIAVMRASDDSLLPLKLIADLTSKNEINRWPIPKPMFVQVDYLVKVGS